MRRVVPSIAVVAVLFLAVAGLDLYRGLAPLIRTGHVAGDDLTVLAVGAAAAVGGACVLYGHKWARWLLAAWMLLHLAVNAGEPFALVTHVVIFGLIAYALFRPGAAAHFRTRAAP